MQKDISVKDYIEMFKNASLDHIFFFDYDFLEKSEAFIEGLRRKEEALHLNLKLHRDSLEESGYEVFNISDNIMAYEKGYRIALTKGIALTYIEEGKLH